jgi:acyl-homoserine lactone acylase PvdQ
VLGDFQDWVDGVNAFYRQTEPAGSRPAAWTVNDVIAVFSFIGSVFGHGGGDEVRDSDLLAALEAQLGRPQGLACSGVCAA